MIKAIDDEFPDDVLIKEYWYPKSKDAGTASCTSKRFIYLFDKGAVGAARREAVPARPRPARSPCRSPRSIFVAGVAGGDGLSDCADSAWPAPQDKDRSPPPYQPSAQQRLGPVYFRPAAGRPGGSSAGAQV